MTVSVVSSRVQAHLGEVLKDPTRALDRRLLETIDRQVTGMGGYEPIKSLI